MAWAEERGAYLPGSPGQRYADIPRSLAAAKSTPPGAEAISIIRACFRRLFKSDLSRIGAGIVLKIKSKLSACSFSASGAMAFPVRVSASARIPGLLAHTVT